MKKTATLWLPLAAVFCCAAALPPALEQSLGKLPVDLKNDPYLSKIVFSQNSAHFALRQSQGTKFSVMVDGKSGPDYAEIGDIAISPDGLHTAYSARKDKNWLMVLDGQEIPAFDGVAGRAVFSPDSQHVVYRAKKGTQLTTVADGKAGPFYDFDFSQKSTRIDYSLAYSPDSRHLAYVAGQGSQFRVVFDGKPGPLYEAIGSRGAENGIPWFVFSADSQHYAYRALKGDKLVVVRDGQEGPEYVGYNFNYSKYNSGFPPNWFLLSPDGKHLAYLAVKDSSTFNNTVVVDGREGATYDSIDETTWLLSSDGKHLAYFATKNGKDIVVWDGHESREYEYNHAAIEKNQLKLSADGQHLAYVAKLGGRNFVVRDNVEESKFDGDYTNLSLSADGRHLAYIVVNREVGDFVVVDGTAGRVFNSIRNDPLTFTPDGKILAYIAVQDGQYFCIAGGRVSPPYDLIAKPGTSADGQHFGFWAKKGPKWVLVLDGLESPPFDNPTLIYNTMPAPIFRSEKNSPVVDFLTMSAPRPTLALEYLATRNGILYRVTQPLPAPP